MREAGAGMWGVWGAWGALLVVAGGAAGQTLGDITELLPLPNFITDNIDDLVALASEACNALPKDLVFSKSDFSEEMRQVEVVEYTRRGSRRYRLDRAPDKVRKVAGPGDRLRGLVIYVPGWLNRVADVDTQHLVRALLTKHRAVLVLDTGTAFGRGYMSAAARVDALAARLAAVIKAASPEILIGFSLGAHVVAAAARQAGGVPELVALDPAAPCFPDVKFAGAARHVQVIHATPGTLGVGGPAGDLDVYLNRPGRPQPECEGRKVTLECDHGRAVRVYARSVGGAVRAVRCGGGGDVRAGTCGGRGAAVGHGGAAGLRGVYLYSSPPQRGHRRSDSHKKVRVFNLLDPSTWFHK